MAKPHVNELSHDSDGPGDRLVEANKSWMGSPALFAGALYDFAHLPILDRIVRIVFAMFVLAETDADAPSDAARLTHGRLLP
jgi:hypothetical protein